tara:strand:- start:270 stop:1190 length:921 start_codon:yes stop_codon:yes gene_type:complete
MSIFKNKKIKNTIIGAGIIIFIVIIFGIGIYRAQWQSNIAYVAARIIPYPAILVDWEFIPLHIYINDLQTLNKYWNFQRDNTNVLLGIPNQNEIRERLINKLITEKIIHIWARKNRIQVSDEELYLEWERLKTKPGGEEEITQFLDDAYGWSDKKFIDRVLHPFLLQQKVKAALLQERGETDETIKEDALEIYVLAIEQGADFSELAKQYSYDAISGPKGGDLGYFGRGTLEPQLESAIFDMEIGQISKPIKSSFGYHIVKLEDLLYSDTGVATKARASHILIRGFDFNEWIEKQKQELAIYRLVI